MPSNTLSIAVTGATGLLGTALCAELKKTKHKIHPFSKKDLDIRDENAIKKCLDPLNIDLLINCAAFTKVDDCEHKMREAFAINRDAVKLLANYCKGPRNILIHFSTDYVFDGRKRSPYTEEDPTEPINTYGLSKLAGELAIQTTCFRHYIFRLQWLFGHHGNCFPKTLLNGAKTKKEFSIVSDQWGSPSYSKDIAEYICRFIEKVADKSNIKSDDHIKQKPAFGVYHLHNAGTTNWADYGKFIFEEENCPVPIFPIKSRRDQRPCQRPLNGRLSMEKFLNLDIATPRPWQDAVKEFLKAEKQ